jgi:hypothetical protein
MRALKALSGALMQLGTL